MISSLLILSFLSVTASNAGDAPITRQMLLEGCPIPEKRDFPVGPEVMACENFHDYACSEVKKSFELPADRSSWAFTFHDSAERLLYGKKRYFKFLEEGYAPSTPRASQLRDFYLGCINSKARKSEELALVSQEMANLGNVSTKADLIKILSSRFDTPDFSFVDLGDFANQKDPLLKDLYLGGTDLSLPEKSYYKEAEVVSDLQKLALAFFKTIGSDQPERRAQWLVDFEKGYAEVTPTPAEMRLRITQNNYRPREEFLPLYPNLGFEKLFSLIPPQTMIRDLQPEVLTFLNEAIDKEPVEKIKSVMLFHGLRKHLDEAFPEFFALQFKFNHTRLGGPKERSSLEERCTKTVMKHFKMELDHELLPILFPSFPEKKVRETAERVRNAIIAGLQKNEWLSETARAEATKKISKASLLLVKPKTEKDWNFLPLKRYSVKNPIANTKKVEQLGILKMFKELGEKRNPGEWHMGPLTVNAYYSPVDNQFVLPQAILQPPFFDANGSDVQNLASMGSVVGHELGHGIDDSGRKYDTEGKVRNWMTERDVSEFSSRSGRFIELYDSFGHDGKLTLGENIGDHVGLTFAFNAAFEGKPASLKQARDFYLAYARVWCNVTLPEEEKNQLKTDPHALGWARINGQVIHHEAFVNAFSCNPGQKMFLEKEKRIRVW